jgi:hypothetical protein
MADRLLRERGGKPVGKHWVDNFVKRTPELKKRWSRPYDCQQAAFEDPALIQPWFELVQSVKAKYGILDEDTWNFDKTGFLIGKIRSQLVVTGSHKPGKAKKLQPGNCEWTILIQAVGATRKRIPLFIIFAGKVLISTWFELGIPCDWVIQVSPNGWTSNDLRFAWLKHFNLHAKPVGVYRMLIIDGHKSHCLLEFQDYCKENKIITLCMLSHSLHLLQPLDVTCFAPLKRSYGNGISALARNHIHHISKKTFLPVFKAAYEHTFTEENARTGFRGAGLVPFNPDAVLSKLDVRLRTPTPPRRDNAAGEAKTLRNAKELEDQTTLIQQRMQKCPGSSASSLDKQVQQLSKGAQQIAHNMVLLQEEQAHMRSAIEELTKRKGQRRRYVRVEEILTVGEV